MRAEALWRDIPDEFGKWKTVYMRFWRWARKGIWESLFKRLAEDPVFEYVMIDGTIIRVHQHGAGARGGLSIRRSGARAAV